MCMYHHYVQIEIIFNQPGITGIIISETWVASKTVKNCLIYTIIMTYQWQQASWQIPAPTYML